MAERERSSFKKLKERAKEGFEKFKLFFKEFKWDKAHVSVLLKYGFEVLFFAFIITFDLTMKSFLYDFVEIRHGGNFTVIDGFLDLTYSENTGMGFGFGKESTLGITIMTAVVIVVILLYLIFFKKEKAYIRVPLIMVAAGGIGNLADRVQLGYVRDFFEFTFMDFAIFNIADAFVTVGAIVLIIALVVMMFFPSKDKRVTDGGSDEPAEENAASSEGGETGSAAAEEITADDPAGEESADGEGNGERQAFTIVPSDGAEHEHEEDGQTR